MELYHLLNRGVEKRDIFTDDAERARFVHDMYEFNDTNPAPDTYRTMWEIRSPTLDRQRTPIVDIHGWCLMGNHYHLLVSERHEGGLTLFSRRLNVGYAMYFNEKHQRSGVLFQGRTKKIPITSNSHFLYILHYIHLNPLDFLEGATAWRTSGVETIAGAMQHLATYRWSSYLDYCGEKNFPSVISTELFSDTFNNDYQHSIHAYIEGIDLNPIQPLLLE